MDTRKATVSAAPSSVDAVRRESAAGRLTRLSALREAQGPSASLFGLAPEQIEGILSRIRERGDCRDIRASNDARYLYSTLHLTVARAEALTEWNEAGQAENP